VKSESASDSPFGLKWKVWESKETGFNIDANLSVVVWPTTTEENAAVRYSFFSFLSYEYSMKSLFSLSPKCSLDFVLSLL